MKLKTYIRLIGVVLVAGILESYITLNNGVILISQGQVLPVLIGIAEICRWLFGLLAAILLIRAQTSAQWLLFIAFLCGLVSSWVPFIPFAGYLMRYADQTSAFQNFIVLQAPNAILVLLVFYLFSILKKADTTRQPKRGATEQ